MASPPMGQFHSKFIGLSYGKSSINDIKSSNQFAPL